MGLLSQLKSLLGLDSGTKGGGNDVDVTVEREPDTEPDASSEHAVKDPADEVETEEADRKPGVDESETEAYEEEIEENAPAAGTDAAASTETLVEEDNADEPNEAAEPAEAAGPTGAEDAIEEAESDDIGTDEDEAVDESETEAYEEEIEEDAPAADTDAAASTETLVEEDNADEPNEAAEPAEAAGPASELDQSTEHIKGIGPAYAETLAEAGVGTIADLAAVEDTDALSEETGLSAKRLGRWVERARSWEP